MNVKGIRFKGYKSFGEDFISMESFPNMTVFVGRNNSGKSSCIDILESLTDPEVFYQNSGYGLEIQLEHVLTEEDVRRVFPESTYGGSIPARNHYAFGKNYVGKSVTVAVSSGYGRIFTGDPKRAEFKYEWVENDTVFPPKYKDYWKKFAVKSVNIWEGYTFRRLDAERNIVPEKESDSETLSMTGAGASNLIRKIVNYSEYDEKMVEETLLEALNRIIYPDSQYSGIRVQQIEAGNELLWEIYLQEGTQRFALSKMGSGLKTIILVLLNLLIIPKLKKYKNKKIIYAFEELENNLHPALQRRLFDYLYEYSCEHDVLIFLTTHSHVAINAFCEKQSAQILHVTKQNGISSLHRIDSYFSKSEVLNDLDVRASDLLQANGIIWVEGPSDRVYIKRWLEIWGGDDFQEGRDYQFLYYGGRLLSHYTAEMEQKNLINVLLTNRNAAIVIDSDKRSDHSRINDTKKRIQEEFKEANAFCWITQGKEIENYVANAAIEEAFQKRTKGQCGQYELFPEYIADICPRFVNEKVLFAQKVCKYITPENSDEILNLKKQTEKLLSFIRKWNPHI